MASVWFLTVLCALQSIVLTGKKCSLSCGFLIFKSSWLTFSSSWQIICSSGLTRQFCNKIFHIYDLSFDLLRIWFSLSIVDEPFKSFSFVKAYVLLLNQTLTHSAHSSELINRDFGNSFYSTDSYGSERCRIFHSKTFFEFLLKFKVNIV